MIRYGALIAVGAGLMLPSAWALSIAPTSLELDLRQGDAEVELTLSADADAPLDIELELVPRDPTASSNVAVDLLPPLLTVPAGESRRVRLRARPIIGRSGSASFFMDIQPVGLETDFSEVDSARREVRFRTRFLVPVHVDLGGTPDFRCRLVTDVAGRHIELRNAGNRYLRFAAADVHLRDADQATIATFSGLALARPLATDALLPGQTVLLPIGDAYPAASAVTCRVSDASPAGAR